MLHNSPFDWDSVLKITNDKTELAQEIISMFIAELPIMHININQAYQQKNYAALLEFIHKFHGSCCYCGVPHLKELCKTIENDLKQQNYAELPKTILALNQEVKIILDYAKTHKNIFEEKP